MSKAIVCVCVWIEGHAIGWCPALMELKAPGHKRNETRNTKLISAGTLQFVEIVEA